MKNILRLYVVFALLMTNNVVMADYVPVMELSSHADALNIEGGIIPSQELKSNQMWANLAVVLDRPVLTKETLEEITAKNSFALKEASILSYDESTVNLAYASILNYYLKNGRILSNKSDSEDVKIVFQIHRNSSAKNHLDLFLKILDPWIKADQLVKQEIDHKLQNHLATYIFKPTNSIIEFRKGFNIQDLKFYDNSDIVVGFSMVAGLQANHPSGALLMPNSFIPYEVSLSKLDFLNRYSARNHLNHALKDILSQQSDELLEHIKSIGSDNPLKTRKPLYQLTENDFYDATILQADGYFYPSFS